MYVVRGSYGLSIYLQREEGERLRVCIPVASGIWIYTYMSIGRERLLKYVCMGGVGGGLGLPDLGLSMYT